MGLQQDIDAVRADGGMVRIRPMRAADKAALDALIERASDRSIYLRFFAMSRTAGHRFIEHLMGEPGDSRRALVAVIDNEVIALAGYERMSATQAEVALLIDDEHQHAGIGTLLLENLASTARAEGIEDLVAQVLAENTSMVTVLRSLGFAVDTTISHGEAEMVCHLGLTDRVQAAVNRRERLATTRSLRPILAPTSIAVIGASERAGSVGRSMLDILVAGGFTGAVYPVNPSHATVSGLTCYPSPSALPEAADLALVAVPADSVLETVRACGERGVRAIVLVTAGFREADSRGADAETEVLEVAREYGMRVVGPNCLGVANTDPAICLDATFVPLPMRRGGLGLATQSGALGIAVAVDMDRCGVGLSQFVSLGNKADVSGNDLIMWWADDPDTRVIALYLESFGNPRKFLRIAREVTRTKPILAIKSGRSAVGRRAGHSHTAAAATPDDIVDALCEQAGVVRLDTLEQLIATARVLDSQPLPAGPRLAVIGNSGGPGIMATDAAVAAGLVLPALSERTVDALRQTAPSAASCANPIDLSAEMTSAELTAALDVLIASGEVDAVAVVVTQTTAINAEQAAHAAWHQARTIPVVVAAMGATAPGPSAAHGPPADPILPARFEYPEPAVAALAAAWRYAHLRSAPVGTMYRPEGIDEHAARDLLARSTSDGWLDAAETRELLESYGITLSPQRVVTDVGDAISAAGEIGYPVALKANGVVHKTDVGGVRLDLRGPDEVRVAFAALAAITGSMLVQAMARPGLELIVGSTRDEKAGAVVMLGIGGVLSGLIADRSLKITPVTDADADAMIGSLRAKALFDGFRGYAPIDKSAVRDLILRVSRLVSEYPQIAELDLNPVICDGARLTIVDAKVRIRATQPLSDPMTRALSAVPATAH